MRSAVTRIVALVAVWSPLVQDHPATRPARHVALLVGIDRYAAPAAGVDPLPVLRGCAGDVDRVRSLLIRRFGFAPDDVRVLRDGGATHAKIVQVFRDHLIANASPDHEALFYFAGHGSRVPDQSGRVGAEPAGMDSSLIACDSRVDGPAAPFDVTDDELHSLLAALCQKTTRVTVLTDSCHSGSVVRGPAVSGVRAVGDATAAVDRTRVEPLLGDIPLLEDGDPRRRQLAYVHLAACGPGQTTGEAEFPDADGRVVMGGLFTHFLVDVLAGVEPGVSFEQLAARIDLRMAGRTLRFLQQPSAEGAVGRQVFGAGFAPPLPGFEVWPDTPTPGILQVQAGWFRLMRPGSRFEIRDQRGVVGHATLTKVGATLSAAAWDGTPPALAPGTELRAVEIERAAADRRLRIGVEGAPGQVAELARLPVELAAGDAAGLDACLRATGSRVVLEAAPGGLRLWDSDPDEPVAVAVRARSLAEAVQDELLYRTLMELADTPGPLRLALGMAPPSAAELRDWLARQPGPAAHAIRAAGKGSGTSAAPCLLTHGDGENLAVLRVTLAGTDRRYVAVFSVSEDRDAHLLWPEPETPPADAVLEPGKPLSIMVDLGVPGGWPAGRPLRDRYFAVATAAPADFRALATAGTLSVKLGPAPGTQRGAPEAMPELLAAILAGRGLQRGGGSVALRGQTFGVAAMDVMVQRAPQPAPQSQPVSLPDSQPSRVGRALIQRGRQASDAGDAKQALEYLRTALVRCDQDGDGEGAAEAQCGVATCLRELDRAAESVAEAERGLARWTALRGPVDHADVADALLVLARCQAAAQRPVDALATVRRAMAMTRTAVGEQTREMAIAQQLAAEMLLPQGEHAQVIELLSAMLRTDDLHHVVTKQRRAEAHRYMSFCLAEGNRYAEALVHSAAALEIVTALGPGHERALVMALHNHATNLDVLGRPAEALALAQREFDLVGQLPVTETWLRASATGKLGYLLDVTGQKDQALPLLRQAVALRRQVHGREHVEVATALNNLAACLQETGQAPEAVELFKQALEIYQKAARGRDTADVAMALNNLANCLQLLGRSEDGLRLWTRSLAMWQRVFGPRCAQAATTQMSLAGGLYNLGRGTEALDAASAALDILQELFRGPHPTVAECLHLVAKIQFHLGQPVVDCQAGFAAALAMWRQLVSGDHPRIAANLRGVGVCLHRLGQATEAVARMGEALAIERRLDHPDAPVTARDVGAILVELGRPAEAVPYFAEAIARIEELRRNARGLDESDRAAWFATHTRFGAYEDMVTAQLRAGATEEALRYAERRRARGLLDLLERAGQDPVAAASQQASARGDTAAHEAIEQADSRVRIEETHIATLQHERTALPQRADLTAEARSAESTRVDGQLAEARSALLEALRARAHLVREHVPLAQPGEVREIQGLLAKHEILLAWFLDAKASCLFVVRPPGQPIEALPLGQLGDGFAKDVAGYLTAVRGQDAPTGSQPASPERGRRAGSRPVVTPQGWTVGHRLFTRLIPAAVWPEIQAAKRVYVLPDGALHQLPLEALPVAAPVAGQRPTTWLDVGPPVAYAASGSVLLWCRRQREWQQARASALDLLAVGNPRFGPALASQPGAGAARGDLLGSLPPLPGTEREVRGLAALFAEPRCRVLAAEHATEAEVFAHAAQARLLHLATHTISDPTLTQGLGALAFTLPATPTVADDGLLTLSDLCERWRGRLSGCELVVLSACETQRGQRLKDDELMALPWGFLYAGAPAVVASLWRVDDASTAELMVEFYRGMQAGQGKLTALQAARRKLKAKYPEPYHWAPFVFLGDPR